jgi:hypothetical protein
MLGTSLALSVKHHKEWYHPSNGTEKRMKKAIKNQVSYKKSAKKL